MLAGFLSHRFCIYLEDGDWGIRACNQRPDSAWQVGLVSDISEGEVTDSRGRNSDVKIAAFYTEYSLNLAIWTALGGRDKDFDQDSGPDSDLGIC